MLDDRVEFLSAVLIVSREPARLSKFYREVVGIALEDEEHEGTLPHFGCTLGDVHFAIHPVEDFPDHSAGVGSVKLAFTVFDIQGFAARLKERGVKLLYEPRDTGYFWSTAILDPDGNLLEFTQLCDEWFQELEARRAKGHDVLVRFKASRKAGA